LVGFGWRILNLKPSLCYVERTYLKKLNKKREREVEAGTEVKGENFQE
jgi:hypothetical protein